MNPSIPHRLSWLVVFLLMSLTPLQALADEPVETSRQITASEGGELAITNKAGDIVRLTIPPGALPASQEVRLVANATPPAHPLSETVFPGVSISPQELVLQRPAILQIQPAQPLASGSMLFRVASPELVIPMGDFRSSEIAQDIEEKAIELDTKSSALSGDSGSYQNEVFRGGTYITGVPSNQEAQEQSKRLIDMPPTVYPDWQGAKEQIRGILEWAERDMLVGDDAAAESLMNRARDIAGEVIREFLEVPEPANPCDESYYQLMFQLAELSMMGLTHDMPEADKEFQKRMQNVVSLCSLHYELEIDYRRTTRHGPYEVDVQVTGRIPFSVGVVTDDMIEDERVPAPFFGEVELKGSGRSGDCQVLITGEGRVGIAGRLRLGQQIYLELDILNDIFETHQMVCPDFTGTPATANEWRSADGIIRLAPYDGERIPKHLEFNVHKIDLVWTLHHDHKPR
ncbi:MAG: hypothetical protein P8Z78_02030 [Gammaproteobacteria bacterium]